MDHRDEPTPACPYMTSLVDLLRDFPRPGCGDRGGPLAERLDGLEYDARRHDAPSETIGAIRGVRVLLDLAELPPLRGPETGGPRGPDGDEALHGSGALGSGP